MNEIQTRLLEAARRRTVDVAFDAKVQGVSHDEIRAAIRALLRQKLIYRSSDPIKNFFGSGFAGYRANKEA